ncbi:MAG: acyl carrier protein [Lysobacteraceae bacterium]|nr:MAG: acyl carrier protein [Xanthomonadaceae bacterium]
MNTRQDTVAAVLEAINDIKKTGFTNDSVELDFYLGGDLGVDSREMLEIWYELEQRLGIQVKDEEKRDLYTLGDVVSVLDAKLGAHASVA